MKTNDIAAQEPQAPQEAAREPSRTTGGDAEAILQEICNMQMRHYGDGMDTHLALIDLCSKAREILAASASTVQASQPAAQAGAPMADDELREVGDRMAGALEVLSKASNSGSGQFLSSLVSEWREASEGTQAGSGNGGDAFRRTTGGDVESIGDDPGFRAAAVLYAKAKRSETAEAWKNLVAAADRFHAVAAPVSAVPAVQVAMTRDEISELIAYTADNEGFDTTTPEGVDALIHAVVDAVIERAAPVSPPDGAMPEPFRLGNEYQTQAGEWVRFVRVHNEGTDYETMEDQHGHNRYTRRDFGRGTGTAHDYSDPGNTPPLYRAAQPAEGSAQVARPETIEVPAWVYGSARDLAVAIWRDNYKETAPQWEPLDDLAGVISQIDNMVCSMKLTAPNRGEECAVVAHNAALDVAARVVTEKGEPGIARAVLALKRTDDEEGGA